MEIEALVSGTLVALLGVLFLLISFLNLFGSFSFTGSAGAKFIYEMDAIMGGLLGLRYYSKLEFVIMLFSAIGVFSIFREAPETNIVLGLMLGAAYLIVCYAYAVYARQPKHPFGLIASFVSSVALWRLFRFLPRDEWPNLKLPALELTVFIALAVFQMRRRASEMEPLIERFARIQQFCLRNPEFVWIHGNDAPEGFVET